MAKAKKNDANQISTTIFRKRLRKFRTLKRGWYSFIVLLTLYVLSFFLPLAVNNKPLYVRHQGKSYFPLVAFHDASEFGVEGYGAPDYRKLKQKLAADGTGYVVMPLYPYHPNESLLELPGEPPHAPSREHWCGTDNRGRDVFARLVYGFRTSISFALIVTAMTYTIGISIGAMLGYFGGRFDIFMQRLIEIWSSMPYLYTIIIVTSILQPEFFLLAFVLTLFGWMGMTYYVRGEFYREKAKDYVAAAIAIGANNRQIIFRHILPNALTPVVSFAPFAVVAYIGALVSLDFLGFGMAPPTPSWGQLVSQGMDDITSAPWLVLTPLLALFFTLLMVVFIGEAVREAFDPKVYSRLR
ncbi:MAG: ABC transporter permease subunit [Candidatus Krumholzibacteriota bacterium]|nr:ABC transporter permease subunit [Candidatus Krumholzibacteriota bacterium]